jgi:hypothetical protein
MLGHIGFKAHSGEGFDVIELQFHRKTFNYR